MTIFRRHICDLEILVSFHKICSKVSFVKSSSQRAFGHRHDYHRSIGLVGLEEQSIAIAPEAP